MNKRDLCLFSVRSFLMGLFAVFFLGEVTVNGQAKRGLVKVATIGASAPSFSNRKDMEKVGQEISSFWKSQINQVLPDKPDLILLPEFFDVPSGFNSKTQEEFARFRGDKSREFLGEIARKNQCYIAYGTLIFDKAGLLRNAAVLLDRNGNTVGEYYKNFPTIGELESGIIAGTEAPVFETDFGKVGLAICFDLNFEELRNKFAAQSPDILLFPSMYHGGHMQNNWAYACRSYFIGAISGRGTFSQVRDPLGEVVATTSNYNNFAVADINLNARLVHLGYNEGKLAAVKKKYGSKISIKDPGNLGPVLLSCNDPSLNVDSVLKEFEIENMHDYYNRSREVRRTKLSKTIN